MGLMNNDVFDSLFGEDEESGSKEPIVEELDSVNATRASSSTEVRAGLASVGGGRGVFTLQDLKAGCLVLSEAPIVEWGGLDLQEAAGLEEAIRGILQSRAALDVCKKTLYPQSLAALSQEQIERARSRLDEDIMTSICSDFSVESDVVLHILSVLEHNGLTSGLYENLSMINHDCIPNCIVYAPRPSSFGMAEVWYAFSSFVCI